MVNSITLHASAARTASGDTHSVPIDVSGFDEGIFFLEVSASDTPTSLDVDIETYDPVTDDWYKIGNFAQMAGNGKAAPVLLASLGQKIALSYALIGTSFTFSVSGIVKEDK